jgi:hypothetical protein
MVVLRAARALADDSPPPGLERHTHERSSWNRTEYGIFMPLADNHFDEAKAFVQSYCANVHDAHVAPVAFMLSTSDDERRWRSTLGAALASQGCCAALRWRTSHWMKAQFARDGSAQPLDRVLQSGPRPPNRTRALKSWSSKWNAISLKRVYGLLYFNFGTVLSVDAEVRVIKPVSLHALFSEFVRHPAYFYTVRNKSDEQHLANLYQPGGAQTIALVLNGLLSAPPEWAAEHDVRALSQHVASSVGTPAGAEFLDVQQWFYPIELLLELERRLRRWYKTIAHGLLAPNVAVWDAPLLAALQYGSTGGAHFHEVRSTLQAAGLGSYAEQLRPRGGLGERLLEAYGRTADDEQLVRPKLLALVENPTARILVYRELDRPKRRNSTLMRLLPPHRWHETVPAPFAAQAARIRELVCAARDALIFSVCAAPALPFHCREDATPQLGPPPDLCRTHTPQTSARRHHKLAPPVPPPPPPPPPPPAPTQTGALRTHACEEAQSGAALANQLAVGSFRGDAGSRRCRIRLDALWHGVRRVGRDGHHPRRLV